MNTRLLLIIGVGLLGVAVASTVLLINAQAPKPDAASGTSTLAAGRISVQLPPGQVAFVVRADSNAGASSAVRPGDRVDILAFFSAEAAGGQAMTRALVRDTVVLAAERERDTQAVTLAIAPDQVLLLQQAELLGARPFVVLRSGQGRAAAAGPNAVTEREVETWITRGVGERGSGGTR